MTDVVEYTVSIRHHLDGEIEISIQGVGDSESDRAAIVYALNEATRLVQDGEKAIFH